jgi:hypothetical protein
MATTTQRLAFVIGLAGAFALAVTTASLAAPKEKPPKDSYEAWGMTSKEGVPPVPGAVLSTYKPGMCWRTFAGQDHHMGVYISCTECKKLSASLCTH